MELKGKFKNYILLPLYLTMLLAAMDFALYFVSKKAGILMTLFVVVYFCISLFAYFYNRKRLAVEMISFATQYATVQKRLLDEFQVPYALMDYQGKILWQNQAFAEVSGKEKKYHKSIASIFPTITKEQLDKVEGISTINIETEDHFYRASLNRIFFNGGQEISQEQMTQKQESEQYLTILYLFDETTLHNSLLEINNQKLVTGLVYIDNYEEALDSIEEVKRSLLVALIDRRVNKYFTNVDAIVKKVEKDKYFIVFKQQYLSRLEEDRFSLIEDVKTVKIGNEMAITLSIGIGNSTGTYLQNYEYTRAAIDLALGRGGDQVVIKTADTISYYGGKTQQVEKSTRVKARVKAQALREIMDSKERVVVMGHSISDIDSFGAAIGIYRAAMELGKRAYIVLNEVTSSLRPIKENFNEKNGYQDGMFINSEEALEITDRNTAVVVVDTNRPSYTECPALLAKTKTIVVFDHHRQGAEVIENAVLSYIEPYASSTCEMIAEVLQYFSDDIKLGIWEADSIYAGILIDTNNFMTKTGVRTFEAAAYLKRSGAEVTRVRKMLRNDMDAYKARAEAVRYAEVYKKDFAISVCPAENLESPTIAGAQAANELLNIVGIRASFVLTQYQGKVFISSRSIDEINVQLIMERMGGGGHLNIAGTQLTDCTLQQAKQRLKDTIDEMVKNGDI
ncbi:MAG: DHH family phosphoesterase [Lachnospiraceae bacterium]